MERINTVLQYVGEATNKLGQSWQEWSKSRFLRTLVEALRLGFSVLVRPVPSLQKVIDEKPILAGVWLTVLQGFSLAFGTRYAYEHDGFVLSLLIKNLPSWGWIIFYAVVFPPTLWFLKASVLNLVAEVLGGPPKGLSLLVATAIACSPLLSVLPVAIVFVWFSGGDLRSGFVGHLWFVFAIGVHAWWIGLTLVAVRETYHFSLSQALLTLLLPFIIGLPLALIGYQVLQSLTI